MMNIIIGALSAKHYLYRRAGCIETWVKRAEELNISVVFIIGDTNIADIRHVGRNLFVPCDDSYSYLTHKTALFCKWAISVDGWDYLFKCDDDTYVYVDRLIKFDTGGHDYIGAEWKNGVNYGSGGAGYLLSRRAAKIVADELINIKYWAEDMRVGEVLAKHDIKLHKTDVFKCSRNRHTRPSNKNNSITAHNIDPDMMHTIHSSIYGQHTLHRK